VRRFDECALRSEGRCALRLR